MIRFICHPAIEKLLTASKVKMKYLRSSVGISFISSYLPQSSTGNYVGLLKAVKFRLANPSYHPIALLSFQSKDELKQQDAYGILSLHGTEFLQLPFTTDTLNDFVDECNEKYRDVELSIPQPQWEGFFIPALKSLLQKKLAEIKHEGKLNFISSVTFPLRLACLNTILFPEAPPQVKNDLQRIEQFVAKEEIAEVLSLAITANGTGDLFLQTVADFSAQLNQLLQYSSIFDFDTKHLIFIIDNLNEAYNKMYNF